MTAFKTWYEKHKAEFNAARAARRKADPAYASRQKEYKKPKTGEYVLVSITLSELSKQTAIGLITIRRWRGNKWVPALLELQGAYYLHKDNAALLLKFKGEIDKLGRVPDSSKVEDLVNWLHANWTALET